jgi:hypothetical protein
MNEIEQALLDPKAPVSRHERRRKHQGRGRSRTARRNVSVLTDSSSEGERRISSLRTLKHHCIGTAAPLYIFQARQHAREQPPGAHGIVPKAWAA